MAIEKRGVEVILRPKSSPRMKTLADVARYMREKFPQGENFPNIERTKKQQKRDLNLD